jgi:signal transduction histidine kinase
MIRGVSLSVELEAELPRVLGDRIQLQQVVLNLLLNAFDAISECPAGERTVVVRSQHDDSEVRVSVSDQGHGIRPGERDGLFEPFWTTKPNGLGMGLSISRSIVTSHGGRLWAENNPDRGATFVFALPVHVPVPPPVLVPVALVGYAS